MAVMRCQPIRSPSSGPASSATSSGVAKMIDMGFDQLEIFQGVKKLQIVEVKSRKGAEELQAAAAGSAALPAASAD